MLFRIVLLIHLCLSVNQALKLNRYESQTIVHLKYAPREPSKLCQCECDKCVVNEVVGAKVCEQIQKRFEFKADPNQYLMFCEINPETCTVSTKTVPDFVKVHIIFDTLYFYLAPFYLGGETGPRAFKSMLESVPQGLSIAAVNKSVEVQVSTGTASMPVEFSGILNLQATDADKFYYCTTKDCIKTVNQFCDEVVNALKVSNPVLMEKFMGCTVRRIYPVGKELGIQWSIMIHYWYLISAGKLTKKQDIENQLKIMKEKMKLPSILKSFEPYRVVPLDFCEISAQSVTNQKFFEDIQIPVISRYRISSARYYSDLVRQLLAGDDKHPSCFRNALELKLSPEGQYAKVQIRLFYSLTCYQQRGLKSCEDVTKEVASIWNKGSKILPSAMGTSYSFHLLTSGLPMKY